MAARSRAAAAGADGTASMDPRVLRSRAAIVEAASAHFLEHGYLAANLIEIARQAEVSKRTIYNIYGGKEQLFHAILEEALATAEHFALQVAVTLGGNDEVDDELRDAGVRLARTVLGGRIVPLRRLLIGEAGRFPDLARQYYERAPGRVIAAIAEVLRRYDAQGVLRVEDPALAAEHFAFLVLGASLDRALFNVDRPPTSTEVDRRANAGVDAFLRAYAPDR